MKRITSILFAGFMALSLTSFAEEVKKADAPAAPATAPATTPAAKEAPKKVETLTPEAEAKKACEKEGKTGPELEKCVKDKTAKKEEKKEEKAAATTEKTEKAAEKQAEKAPVTK